MALTGARRVPRRKANIKSEHNQNNGTWMYLVTLTSWMWNYIAKFLSGTKRKREIQVDVVQEEIPQLKKSRNVTRMIEEKEEKEGEIEERIIQSIVKEGKEKVEKKNTPSLSQVISRFGVSINGRNVAKMHFAELYECAMILTNKENNPQLRNEIQNFESKDCEKLRKIVFNLALK